MPGQNYLSQASISVVAGRINALRVARGLTTRQVEERCGVPRSTVSDLQNGHKEPTLGMLVRLAHAFELRSIEELIAPLGTSELRLLEFPNDHVQR